MYLIENSLFRCMDELQINKLDQERQLNESIEKNKASTELNAKNNNEQTSQPQLDIPIASPIAVPNNFEHSNSTTAPIDTQKTNQTVNTNQMSENSSSTIYGPEFYAPMALASIFFVILCFVIYFYCIRNKKRNTKWSWSVSTESASNCDFRTSYATTEPSSSCCQFAIPVSKAEML